MKKEIKVVNTSSLKENPNNKKIYDTDGKVYTFDEVMNTKSEGFGRAKD